MKFGIFSDLHMEFQSWEFTPESDVFYLNAGDTHPQAIVRNNFANKFAPDKYFAVMGNHDYYGGSFRDADTDVFMKCVNGLKIVGTTLWTDIRPDRWFDFREYMMDYRQIKGMNYDRYMNAHKTQYDYLVKSGADIWVMHHLPSYLSIADKYRNSGGNDFFATEMYEQIYYMKNPPKLIVHGHTHERMDYYIGDTRVVCNPRGYPNEQPWYKTYQPKIVEIE